MYPTTSTVVSGSSDVTRTSGNLGPRRRVPQPRTSSEPPAVKITSLSCRNFTVASSSPEGSPLPNGWTIPITPRAASPMSSVIGTKAERGRFIDIYSTLFQAGMTVISAFGRTMMPLRGTVKSSRTP